MRRFIAVTLILGILPFATVGLLRAAAEPPAWAYAIPMTATEGGAAPAASPDTSLKQIPGSPLTFTRQQISDAYGPADWFPGEHPAMPDVVAHGKRPAAARACGLCHYPNGKGRQENAGVSGLPVSYFIQQMNDFRNGVRTSADPRKANTLLMIGIAKALTPEEIKESADYYGAMPWTPWIKVVETDTVPKMESRGGIWVPLGNNQREPIGMRIVETPENVERTELLRDPHAGFLAYAPIGSMKKGEVLVKTGGRGRTVECGLCHGADLQGLGPVPGIAGRSPSYIVRQLFDMQAGTRHGEWTELMKPVVAKLTDEDLVDIAAYVSSRIPTTGAPIH
jgi:cytochrome c553